MLLPSGEAMERETIERMLRDKPINPFNRAPLTQEELVPATALMEEILAWRAKQ